VSFILDALKKSENDRQDSAPAEFTTVSSSTEPSGAPKWLWVLGGLLLLNAVILAFVLLRPDSPPPVVVAPATAPTVVATPAPETAQPVTVAAAPATSTATPATNEASFSTKVADARRSRPAPPRASETITRSEPVNLAPPAPAPEPRRDPEPVADSGQVLLLPTLTELRADGLNLPEMHLDIHVYSGTPDDRFVFINMNKYRERERTSEGPNVSEITPEGVVLDYQGRRFLLPRE
jgi:general secretion pathway protein B